MYTKICSRFIVLLTAFSTGACAGCTLAIEDATSWGIQWETATADSRLITSIFKKECKVFPVPEANMAYVLTSARALYRIKEKSIGILEVEEVTGGVSFTHAFAIGKTLYVASADGGALSIGPLDKASNLKKLWLNSSSLRSASSIQWYNYAIETCGTITIGGAKRALIVMKHHSNGRRGLLYSPERELEPLALPIPIYKAKIDGILSTPQAILIGVHNKVHAAIVPYSVPEGLLRDVKASGIAIGAKITIKDALPKTLFGLTAQDLPNEKKNIIAVRPMNGAPKFYYLTPQKTVEEATGLPEGSDRIDKALVLPLEKSVYVIGKTGKQSSLCYHGVLKRLSTKH
ncbi:MAG: hypothetical protein AAFP93_02645 [Bacteroidota bacterium]